MPAYISEVRYSGGTSTDFVEISVEAGTNVSGYKIYFYKPGGEIENGPYTLGTVQGTMAGKDVYLVNSSTSGFNDLKANFAVALVNGSGTVVQFLSFQGTTIVATKGPANGVSSTNIGTAGTGKSLQSDSGGSSYYTQNTPNSGAIPCYAPGTLIDTPDGPRAVETLRIGDLVETLDHGPMPIRWMRQGDQALDGVGYDGKPIMIGAGAFGPGCPAHDLIVSPQHRILVGAVGQLDGIFGAQYFAPAKALTGMPFIRAMMGVRSITWVHFTLETHEVVWANGCLSESLLLGPMVLNGITALQRREVKAIFGEAAEGEALNGPVARDCLKVRDLQRTIDRLDRSSKAAACAA